MSGPVDVLDDALPGLATALSPDAMARRLRHLLVGPVPRDRDWRVVGIEVLKHKPGRRCVLAYTFDGPGPRQRLFAKTFRNERGAGITEKVGALSRALAGTPDVIVPRPLAYLPDLNMVVTEFVEAQPLAPALYDGDPTATVRRMARALARLHASGVRCERDWGRAEELESTERWLGGVGRNEAGRAAQLLQRLREWAADVPAHPGVSSHNDFYPEQMLDASGAVVLLDLDDASHADPALDLGNFLAHLELRSLQSQRRTAACRRARGAFLDEYRARAGAGAAVATISERVRFYEAASLLRLAGVYARRERWAEALPRPLMDLCETVMTGGTE